MQEVPGQQLGGFAQAPVRWPRDGVPRRPGAWQTTTSRHRALDRLRLIFTCCHPAPGMQARVALTLRTAAGLTTSEIVRACLVTEPPMAKRLVRAKARIRNAGIPLCSET